MLTAEENATLTKVGPKTPLGAMLRRYWQPIALSDQVPDRDGPPLRVRLLDERFVVFRDSQGKVGVLAEHCIHRGASLALGRNEEGGLRCIYHGWKFATDGSVLDIPNDTACRRAGSLRARAHPVREQSGIIWTYIGDADAEPPFRTFDYDTVPAENRAIVRVDTRASWLALWEGGMDSSHVAVLHTNLLRPTWAAHQRGEIDWDPAPLALFREPYEVEDTDYGLAYRALQENGEGEAPGEMRYVPAVLPNIRIVPLRDGAAQIFEVPLDDNETATYIVEYSRNRTVDIREVERTLGLANGLFDTVTRKLRLDWDDGLGQARDAMGANWSGYPGIEVEDFAVAVSQSGFDRTGEHLLANDEIVVRLRRMVLAAIAAVARGEAPPAVGRADMTGVVSRDNLLTNMLRSFRQRKAARGLRYGDRAVTADVA